MISYEAPAKLNLTLHVMPRRSDGYHPLESLVQTIEWVDTVSLVDGESADSLHVDGLDVSVEGNLILKALEVVRETAAFPPQDIELSKTIPVGAGLGGGSSNAAAALAAAGELSGLEDVTGLATTIGADVALFLTGGTLIMRGIGEQVERVEPLSGCAFAVAMPGFEMSTGDVYRRWDEIEGPEGEVVAPDLLPPGLRDGMPIRNDLEPAAVDLRPELGDFMADLRVAWGAPAMMTGSGSGCFGFFPSLDEAQDAAASVAAMADARGVALRSRGIERID